MAIAIAIAIVMAMAMAMAMANYSKYTTSTLAVLSALVFNYRPAPRLTGGALQGDKPTQDSSPF